MHVAIADEGVAAKARWLSPLRSRAACRVWAKIRVVSAAIFDPL